jgi:hypothetical protein
MGIYREITLTDDRNNDIDLGTFDEYLRWSSKCIKTEDANHVLITLPQGKWCSIHRGIAFEIISFKSDCIAPGYIRPRGNGICDIYSETGDTKIKIILHSNEDESYGCSKLSGKLVEYGPYHRAGYNDFSQSFYFYFNHFKNANDPYKPRGTISNDIVSTLSANRCHTLMIFMMNSSSLMIIDQGEAICNFAGRRHWKVEYSNRFNLNSDNGQLTFKDINESHQVNVAEYIPANTKITNFICLTQLNPFQSGSLIKLSNGQVVHIFNPQPTRNTLVFLFFGAMTLLIIPKEPQGKLIIHNIPSEIIDVVNHNIVGISYNVSAPQGLFSASGRNDEKSEIVDRPRLGL